MRLPTKEEKKRMIEGYRSRFIHMVNRDKSTWDELTRKEKNELDKICERHFSMLQF